MSVTQIMPPKPALPGEGLKAERMPGHWLLARLGKRVLRPGGIEMTRRMLAALAIGRDDEVVELAPGLGITAAMTLGKNPKNYTAVDQDAAAAGHVAARLWGGPGRCVIGHAEATGLDGACATVVYGEAMLSMQTDVNKERIAREAARLLKPGGRYGIHEVCLLPDNIGDELKGQIRKDLSGEIRVGVRPLTAAEWRGLMEQAGFQVKFTSTTSFNLLEPWRLLRDEGPANLLRIIFRALRDGEARKRALGMRHMLKKHRNNIAAIVMVAVKV